jgi:hypothetical protein
MRPAFLTRSLGLLTISTLLSGSVAFADPIRVTSGQFSLRHDRPDEFSFFGADGFLLVRAQAALASSPGLNCWPCGSGMPLNLSTVMLFTTGLVG